MFRNLMQTLAAKLGPTAEVSTTARARRSSRRFTPGQDLQVGRGLECLEARRLLSDVSITVSNTDAPADAPTSDPVATVLTMTDATTLVG